MEVESTLILVFANPRNASLLKLPVWAKRVGTPGSLTMYAEELGNYLQ